MMVGTSPPALDIAGLTHDFGTVRVLDGVELRVNTGDFTVLLGLNGAGKTTLYSLITRLYHNHRGSIRIFGHNLRTHASQALSRIGVVFQQPTLDPDLSLAQNMRYHAALHGLDPKTTRQRIAHELDRVDLGQRAGDKVRTLSGGQRRRVEIARALLHRPSLLLLDEPTVGLDIGSRQTIIAHVRNLCQDDGLAVLWATHLIDEVGERGKVAVLHKGRILATGAVDDVVGTARAKTIGDAFAKLVGVEAPSS